MQLSRHLESDLGDGDLAAHYTLLEELHWLLLILGHLLADDNHGEAAVVPAPVMACACVEGDDPCPPLETANLVFQLLGMESRALMAGGQAKLSPQVATTAMWFLRRWCGPYLLMDETKYAPHLCVCCVGAEVGWPWSLVLILPLAASQVRRTRHAHALRLGRR